MGSYFCDSALIENDYLVCIFDRAKSMGDNQDGLPFKKHV